MGVRKIVTTLDQVDRYTCELESWASAHKRQSYANFDITRIAENVVCPLLLVQQTVQIAAIARSNLIRYVDFSHSIDLCIQ